MNDPLGCSVCAEDATCDAPRYTDNHDGTVTSSCCGLVWQQTVGRANWTDAKTYCAGLTLQGGGWRLPELNELYSIVLLGQTPAAPTIDRIAFPNTPAEPFLSARYCCPAGSQDDIYVFGFVDGESTHWDAAAPAAFRCVR